MKKTSLAAIAALISFASLAKISTGEKVVAPLALATYVSKCGDTWDFVIPYTSLRQVPGFMTQMMDDADKACGTDISYYEY